MRTKAAKLPTLAEARNALTKAMTIYDDAVAELDLALTGKDHPRAVTAFKTAHDAMLATKDNLNLLYSFLAELRPKTEPKPPRKSKAKEKVRPKRENHATVERDEASSDEPSDPEAV
jgi:hypothetical protein